jgi:radical SAM protein with 4Fe4S-binding SPASM domain
MTTNNLELLPFPRVLRVEPASQCNLACWHCPTGTVEMPRSVMMDQVFKKVLEEIERHKAFIKVVVLYHGGEPLLNRNFYGMVAQIKSINASFLVKTVSNGMVLNRKHSEHIISSGLDVIEFSLDGESSNESQYVRERSNTQRIVKNIKGLLELKAICGAIKPDIYIATTQFLRDKNQVNVPGEPPVPAWLEQIFGGEVSGFKSTYALRWPFMGDSGKFDLLTFDGQDSDECDHIINTLTICADESVVPCCYDLTSKLVMGNIFDQSLMDIWNGRKYQILRRSIASKKYISICATCAVVRPATYLIPKWKTV